MPAFQKWSRHNARFAIHRSKALTWSETGAHVCRIAPAPVGHLMVAGIFFTQSYITQLRVRAID